MCACVHARALVCWRVSVRARHAHREVGVAGWESGPGELAAAEVWLPRGDMLKAGDMTERRLCVHCDDDCLRLLSDALVSCSPSVLTACLDLGVVGWEPRGHNYMGHNYIGHRLRALASRRRSSLGSAGLEPRGSMASRRREAMASARRPRPSAAAACR